MSHIFKMLPLLTVVLAGCQVGMDGLAPGSLITPTAKWLASGTMRNAGHAIDSNPGTRAIADGNGEFLDIDLGSPCIFNYVRITHGRDNEFPPEILLYASMDGKEFQQVHKSPGTRKVTNLLIATPCLARQIRIKAEGVTQEWSISDVLIR